MAPRSTSSSERTSAAAWRSPARNASWQARASSPKPYSAARSTVEVLVLGAHGPEVEGQPGPDGLAGRADVAGHGHRDDRGDIDLLARATRAREALVQAVEQNARRGGVEEEGQPAVGDLTRLHHGPWPDGAEVDGDAVLDRLGQELQRPAQADSALALELHRLAGQRAPDRLHVLAGARGRPGERHPVPAF